jgi:hypothetical protein
MPSLSRKGDHLPGSGRACTLAAECLDLEITVGPRTLWNNRLVQDDPPKLGNDRGDTDPQPSEPAGPSPADHGTEPGNGESDLSASEVGRTAEEAASGKGELDSTAVTEPKDPGERLLALQRQRDAQDNLGTRPVAGEVVAFRSVSVAEVFVGHQIDSLTNALAAIDWFDSDEPIVDRIAEARKGGHYLSGNFSLISDTEKNRLLGIDGRTSVPTGIDRIYGQYYVAGPSTVALVLTFALADEDVKKIDSAIRDDAESRLDRPGDRKFRIKTVENVKKERVRTIRNDFTQRCVSWLRGKMPGSLSATTEGPGSPVYVLVTLAHGKPFETQDPYMFLLDLKLALIALKFVDHDFLFLTHPLDMSENEMVGAFNESEALSSDWLPDLGAAPEMFHEAVSSLMIADALHAVLVSFEPRLQAVRAELGKLDLDNTAGSQVVELRNRLLGISREVSIVCSDVSVLLADAVVIWRDLLPLTRLGPGGGTPAPADATAEAKKRQLRTTMESLQAQEAGLRDLILVTSQSVSETRNLDLQTKVLDLTAKLRGLTTWLIVLTVVLVVLGVATLWVQVANTPNTPTGTVNATLTPHPGGPASSTAPRSSPTSGRSAARR